MPPPPRFIDRAFTLAEVLITLAIIGVVAALTIPSLIINYQKQQYVAQLKKSYSSLTQGFKMMMAQNQVMDLDDTPLLATLRTFNNKKILAEFKKYFKVKDFYLWINSSSLYSPIMKTGGYKNLTNNATYPLMDRSALLFEDGTILIFYDYTVNIRKSCVSNAKKEELKAKGSKFFCTVFSFLVDVNGIKGPNRFGRDLFWFEVAQNGNIYPRYGKDTTLKGGEYWKISDDFYCNSKRKDGSLGWGCAARIMEEGWKMKY